MFNILDVPEMAIREFLGFVRLKDKRKIGRGKYRWDENLEESKVKKQ